MHSVSDHNQSLPPGYTLNRVVCWPTAAYEIIHAESDGTDPEQSAIHIKVDEVSQLFNTLDPFPFRERDLDRDAEDFIVGWARELPRQRPIHVVIHATAATVQHIGDAAIADALNRYFTYRAESASLELNELFRQGRLSLFIGLMVLAICLMANRAVDALFGPGQVGRYLGEGLIILG